MTSMPDATSAAARPAPDPERLGGIGWVRRTKGELTEKERRRLMGVVVAKQGAYIIGRIKLATGRVPAGAAVLDDPELLAPPDSAWARAAESACREQQPETVRHSYRTWAFRRRAGGARPRERRSRAALHGRARPRLRARAPAARRRLHDPQRRKGHRVRARGACRQGPLQAGRRRNRQPRASERRPEARPDRSLDPGGRALRSGGFPPLGFAEAVGSEGDRGAPTRWRHRGGGGDDQGGVESSTLRPPSVVAALRVLAAVGNRTQVRDGWRQVVQ